MILAVLAYWGYNQSVTKTVPLTTLKNISTTTEHPSILQTEPNQKPAEENIQQQIAPEITQEEPDNTQQPISLTQLHFLQSCYNEIDCGYPNNDPRQVTYLIGQDIREELLSLLQRWQKNEIDSEELSQAAIESLNNPDGHVQQAAIEIFSELPTSQNHYTLMFKTLSESYNAKIIKQIMQETQRYSEEKTSAQIDQIFIQQLKTGAPYASQEVAKNLLPFINSNNFILYKETLISLPPKSRKSRLLKSTLEEFERLQTGG